MCVLYFVSFDKTQTVRSRIPMVFERFRIGDFHYMSNKIITKLLKTIEIYLLCEKFKFNPCTTPPLCDHGVFSKARSCKTDLKDSKAIL